MQENPSKAATESKTPGDGQDDASHATGRTPACGVSDATGRTPARSVDVVRNHPVMPPHVRITGFVMDSVTGELVQVTCP